MKKSIIKILDKLEQNGFEAYIVGGYVRDSILNIKTNDIDICTNAKPKDIMKLFNVRANNYLYGSFNIINDKYNIDITTYRKETYSKITNKPKITYTGNLIDDLKRRDFTINAICMNKNGEIIDLLDATKDIENKDLILIGDEKTKLKEDPLRILRAIRFSANYDLRIDNKLNKYIKFHSSYIKKLSYDVKLKELKKVSSLQRAPEIFKLYKKYNIDEELEISYRKINKCSDVFGYLAQIDFHDKYVFTKKETRLIKNIKKIIKYGIINNITLYEHGLYINKVAGEVLGYKISEVNDMFNNLHIKSKNDINITALDIMQYFKLRPSKQIRVILEEVTLLILENELKNNKEDILKYINERWHYGK